MNVQVFGVILVAVLQLLTTVIASGFSTPAQVQNLTAIVNQALADKTNETMSNLRKMLKLSPFVYYETDLLLQDIDQLVPVIDLLEEAKPSDSKIQIKLVLNYIDLETGLLKPKRLLDVYFKPELILSSDTKSKITEYVTSVGISLLRAGFDFHWQSNRKMLTNDTLWKVSEREPLVNHVKSFLHFHLGNTSKIPVGIVVSAFDRMMLKNDTFLSRQWNASDFVVVEVSQMASINPKVWYYNMEYVRKRVIRWCNLMPYEILINFMDDWWPFPRFSYFAPMSYNNSLLESLETSRFLNETTQKLATKVDRTVRSFFCKFVLKWARVNNQRIIVSSPSGVLPGPDDTAKEIPGTIIPSFKQSPFGSSFKQLRDNVTNVMGKYRDVIFNEETWGALVNNSDQIKGGETSEPLNAIVEWSMNGNETRYLLEDYMSSLVLKENTPGGIHLSTLVFNQTDIKMSLGIQSFLARNEALNISIGCSLSFSDAFINDKNGTGNFKTRASKGLCGPIFSSVKTMIWKVNGNANVPIFFDSKGYYDAYFYVMLAREIFLQEFPDKQVILEFGAGTHSKTVFNSYEAMFAVDFTK